MICFGQSKKRGSIRELFAFLRSSRKKDDDSNFAFRERYKSLIFVFFKCKQNNFIENLFKSKDR
jgi:hypothetical protein